MNMDHLSRRAFLKTASALTIGFQFTALAGCSREEAPGIPQRLNAWLRIEPDNRVAILTGQTEMGQGIGTALAQVIAAELGVDWSALKYEVVTGSPEHVHPLIYSGEQITGGSTSTMAFLEPARRAGALARQLLIQAGAAALEVAPGELIASGSRVIHRQSQRSLTFSELAAAAAALPTPAHIDLRPASELQFLGSSMPRLDSADKVSGKAVFGVDVTRPGMLFAAIRHAPVLGASVLSIDASALKELPGIVAVVPLENCVAVVADQYWRAQRAVEKLNVTFSETLRDSISDEDVLRELREAQAREAAVAASQGEAISILRAARAVHRAEYFVPYLAHATMEPMSCTADVHDGRVEVWVGTQAPTLAARAAAEVAGVAPEHAVIHVTLAGGGFGRRGGSDFVKQAVALSRAVQRPVKLIWSRKEDIQHDCFRPAMLARFTAALDPASRRPLAVHQRNSGPSLWKYSRPELVSGRMDPLAVEGSTENYYAIPHKLVDYVMTTPDLPIGFWRSVGYSHNTFFVESFIDELAHCAGADPYRYRRDLLAGNDLATRVLDRVATLSRWDQKLPDGHGRGIAFFHSERWRTPVAMVAEVEKQGASFAVTRICCAADAGTIVNPDVGRAQLEGGIIFGLTAALHGRIGIEAGRVQQSNFHDYPLLYLATTPQIEVDLFASGGFLGGLGELGTPAVAPAVTNALFAATGRRVRSLPIL
jgi:isoquinoline 1-oxidoreductase subunit beta